MDDALSDYEARTHSHRRGAVTDRPIAGCFRIRVPVGVYRRLRCEVDFVDASIRNTGSSGQCYADPTLDKCGWDHSKESG